MARRETANMLRRKVKTYEKLMDNIAKAIRKAEEKHEKAMLKLTAKLDAHSSKASVYRERLKSLEVSEHRGAHVQHWMA